jgi:hypothetical protein
MATKWYGKAAQAVATKKIDLTADDIKVMLVGSGYVPNQDTHATKANVTNEVTGAGYAAGGKSLAGKALVQNTSTNTWKWDANDLTWTGATVTFRYAVLYDDSHADKPLIGYVDFGSNQVATNQDVTIKWEYSFQDELTLETTSSTGILELGY